MTASKRFIHLPRLKGFNRVVLETFSPARSMHSHPKPVHGEKRGLVKWMCPFENTTPHDFLGQVAFV
jgi:hypothetical protein